MRCSSALVRRVAGWAIATAAAAAAAVVVAFSFYDRPDYRIQSCSLFFFSFLFRSIHSARLSSKRTETKV